eukprot:2517316-Amphidinium_carterae.1
MDARRASACRCHLKECSRHNGRRAAQLTPAGHGRAVDKASASLAHLKPERSLPEKEHGKLPMLPNSFIFFLVLVWIVIDSFSHRLAHSAIMDTCGAPRKVIHTSCNQRMHLMRRRVRSIRHEIKSLCARGTTSQATPEQFPKIAGFLLPLIPKLQTMSGDPPQAEGGKPFGELGREGLEICSGAL